MIQVDKKYKKNYLLISKVFFILLISSMAYSFYINYNLIYVSFKVSAVLNLIISASFFMFILFLLLGTQWKK